MSLTDQILDLHRETINTGETQKREMSKRVENLLESPAFRETEKSDSSLVAALGRSFLAPDDLRAVSSYVETIIREFPENVYTPILRGLRQTEIVKPKLKDSLRREYLIGSSVGNQVRNFLPTVVYTYGMTSDSLVLENLGEASPLVNHLERMTTDQFLSVYLQILLTLDAMHSRYNFTHYDLHDENVLLRKTGADWVRYILKDGSCVDIPTIDGMFPVIVDFGFSHSAIDDRIVGREKVGMMGVEKHGVDGEESFPYHDAYKYLMHVAEISISSNPEIHYLCKKLVDLLLGEEGHFEEMVKKGGMGTFTLTNVEDKDEMELSSMTIGAMLDSVLAMTSYQRKSVDEMEKGSYANYESHGTRPHSVSSLEILFEILKRHGQALSYPVDPDSLIERIREDTAASLEGNYGSNSAIMSAVSLAQKFVSGGRDPSKEGVVHLFLNASRVVWWYFNSFRREEEIDKEVLEKLEAITREAHKRSGSRNRCLYKWEKN